MNPNPEQQPVYSGLYKQLFDNSQEALFITNESNEIIEINKAACKKLGYNRETLLGETIKLPTIKDDHFKLFIKDEEARWMSQVTSIIDEESGKKLFINTITELINTKGNETSSIETQLEKTEKALQESIQKYEETKKELNEFTRIVSHDLKAPMRAIIGFGTFLTRDNKDKLDEKNYGYLLYMMESAKRMTQLIDDLLILSRVGRKFTEIVEVDLNTLVEVIELELPEHISAKNPVITNEKLPILKTQKVWINHLFTNVIVNGILYNESKPPKIHINYTDRMNDYLFEITDNGIGIEEEYHEKIFKVFTRLFSSDEYPGTGAGLALCKKIVEDFGGKIWLRSILGEGTTFYFNIPKMEEER